MDLDKFRQMKTGEKLACGCEVTQEAWSRRKVWLEVRRKLKTLQPNLQETSARFLKRKTLKSLGLGKNMQRELWREFFGLESLDYKTIKSGKRKGKIKYLVPESRLPRVPSTVGKFVLKLYKERKNPYFRACDGHAY